MAFELRLLNGIKAGTVWRLAGDATLIGRDPACDVAFDPERDRVVSARHARVVCQHGRYVIEDLSSGGTHVNGLRTVSTVLDDGDVIELGPAGPQLRFELGNVGQPLAEGGALVFARGATTSSADRRSRSWQLAGDLAIVVRRIDTGESWTFRQPSLRIGRDPGSDIALDAERDRAVSANHARLALVEGQLTIFDSDSTNGTWVDGRAVGRHVLTGAETVQLGRNGPSFTIGLSATESPMAVEVSPGPQQTLASDTLRSTSLTLGQAAVRGVHALRDRILIGRDPRCDVVLDSMYVSKRHASLERAGDDWLLRDLDSANGVFRAGKRERETLVRAEEELFVGPFALVISGGQLVVFDTQALAWVEAQQLCWHADGGGSRAVIDHVSLRIEPRELVCVLGPSGSGKSTLLRSLSGQVRADSGRVLVNGIDFYRHYPQLRHLIGYVPQDDIVHGGLSVERTLEHAARLRLPRGVSRDECRARVDAVMSALELIDRRDVLVRRLSGGQRKRVSIAVELLTEPAVLFLDEPTSGLDPHLEERMMLLLRDLTLRGRAVVAVTHTLDHVELADRLLFLAGGRLVFAGKPQAVREKLGVERLPEVYKRFAELGHDPDALAAQFEGSSIEREPVVVSEVSSAGWAAVRRPRRVERPKRTFLDGVQQLGVLVRRYTELLAHDPRHLLILLLQAPVIALLIVAALSGNHPATRPTATLFFALSLAALWLGCSSAARELTKEGAIFARERTTGLGVMPYVASKFFVLQLVAIVQLVVLLGMVALLRGGYRLADPPETCVQWALGACLQLVHAGVPGGFGPQLMNLYLTALAGIGLGLLISAVAGNSDKAMALVPLLLIPQVLLSGSFGATGAEHPFRRALGYAMPLNWSIDQAKRNATCSPDQELGASGCTHCLHAYDPLKYRRLGVVDQFEDRQCTALQPVLSVLPEPAEALEVIEDGLYTPAWQHNDGPARQAHRSSRGYFVQALMSLVFGLLTCVMIWVRTRI